MAFSRSSASRFVGAALPLLAGLALSAPLSVASSRTEAASAPVSSDRRPDPSRLLFLVEYVGSDYDGAVRDGVVLNQVEYGEVLRFAREAQAEYAKGGAKNDELAAALADFVRDVEERRVDRAIGKSARDIINMVTSRLEGLPSPASPPDLAAGAAVFAAECARCHGDRGAGDGPGAAGLDPAPTSFRGEAIASLSPRRVYGTLVHGIEGTAMASFAAKLSEEQRWNVAFFVMTLREGFAPAPPKASPPVLLEDLAASRNAELLELLRGSDPSASAANVDFLRANASSAALEAPPAPKDPLPDALASAIRLQDAFGFAASRLSSSVVGVTGFVRFDAAAASGDAGGWQALDAAPEGMRALRIGSGFFLPGGRDVATCDHLLRRDDGSVVDLVRIDLADGTQAVARVVGMEPALDLAIVRLVDGDWTKPDSEPDFADSAAVRTGNWLIALGDPPGARTTLAVGVAAAPAARQCYQEERSATMLQSSLVIAPGAHGGPVADIEGKVVGMAVHLPGVPASPNGPAQPAEDAILPANLLLNLHAALDASGSTESPWLGVSVLELGLLRSKLGDGARAQFIPESGVFLDNLFEPSPASRAGVRRGDFLVGFGQSEIASVADFQHALYHTGIGHKAVLRLLRDGRSVEVEVTIEKRPAEATMR